MRIIKGSRDMRIAAANGAVIHTVPEGGPTRIRCMACGQIAVPTTMSDGTKVYRCTACGTSFTKSPMGGASPTAPAPVGGTASPKR